MTANELADKLDLVRIELTIQAATMLRQQAKEIEALKMHELTYEEISDIRDKYLAPKECDIYTFARAILQKASEK